MAETRRSTTPDGREVTELWQYGRLVRRQTHDPATQSDFIEAWHRNGVKQCEASYSRGYRHGTCTHWNEAGEVCLISTRRYGANAGREYSLEGGVIEDGECHEGGLSFRGWITALRDLGPGDLRKGDTIYVDKTERMSVQDGAWYRREAALLCRLR